MRKGCISYLTRTFHTHMLDYDEAYYDLVENGQ